MSDDIAIKVEHVSKTFKLPHEKNSSIKGVLINFARHKVGYEKQQVLKDVSLEIKKGEFFGIVGRNGSGKSTLLKLLAGIYTPDSGGIQINGKLTPFIELGVGFNPELTGRENVFLNGALLGFSRNEMEAMYDDIVAFAELERFMDQKLKNYSSGMQVRLAFSIAIRAQTDILLLDEVLAVGDEAFQRKCQDYFKDLKRAKKTVILVTHDMSQVERFCDRALLIDAGAISTVGSAPVVAHTYSDLFDDGSKGAARDGATQKRWGDGRYKIGAISMHPSKPMRYGENIEISFEVLCHKALKEDVVVAYAVKDDAGRPLFGDKVESSKLPKMNTGDSRKVKFLFPNFLNTGRHFVDLSIYIPSEDKFTDCWLDCLEIKSKTKGVEGYPLAIRSIYQE